MPDANVIYMKVQNVAQGIQEYGYTSHEVEFNMTTNGFTFGISMCSEIENALINKRCPKIL